MFAKSSCWNPFALNSVIASASPRASAAVVLAVGTRVIGHASSETKQSSATTAACPRVALQSRVVATTRAPARPLDAPEPPNNLLGLAAVGQRDNHAVRAQHAEIAVNRFGGMQEERR